MFMGFCGFLLCIRLINLLKELSQWWHHFPQPFYISLYFLNRCLRWLTGVGGCEDTEPMPDLEAGILQSIEELAGFLRND
jgi:hypothetical protein